MELVLVLAVLLVDVVLFVHGRLRMDLVALLTLVFLAVTGLVDPAEALAGFPNPAVVTVWAVFMLSGGLAHTGIVNMVGRQVIRFAGGSALGYRHTVAARACRSHTPVMILYDSSIDGMPR